MQSAVYAPAILCQSVCLSICPFDCLCVVLMHCFKTAWSITELFTVFYSVWCEASRLFSLSSGFVADALAVERDKYKGIATDLDTTFTELAGYWPFLALHFSLILAPSRPLTNCRHRFRFRSRSRFRSVHDVTYTVVFMSPSVAAQKHAFFTD